MNKLEGKTVVVTGGAEGLGYSVADKYLQNGAKVVIILDINEAKGLEAVESLNKKYGERAAFIKCDVTTDLDAVYKNIVEEYKQIDVLVNNAGILNENSARKTIEINVTAVIEWSMKFWEHMRKDKGGNGGTIINMASKAGFLIDPFLLYYKASKFAVIAFTKSLGHEYHYNKTAVRVIALCPGMTDTTLTSKQMCWDEDAENFNKILSRLPWQQPQSVGEAAVEVYEKAPSGTAWIIAGGNPIMEAPDCVKLTLKDLECEEPYRVDTKK